MPIWIKNKKNRFGYRSDPLNIMTHQTIKSAPRSDRAYRAYRRKAKKDIGFAHKNGWHELTYMCILLTYLKTSAKEGHKGLPHHTLLLYLLSESSTAL